MCCCDPLAPCALTPFPSCEAAYDHGIREHLQRAGKKWACPWLHCDYVELKRGRVLQHYQTHLLASWRCNQCWEMHSEKVQALGCRHASTFVELMVQYSYCEWQGCLNTGEQMVDAKIMRQHVLSHLSSAMTPLECRWKGCSKTFSKYDSLMRHVQMIHLKTQYKCRGCEKIHSSENKAMKCCNALSEAAPMLVTSGVTCVWDGRCEEEFPEGDAHALRTHFRAHLQDAQQSTGGRLCLWEDCPKAGEHFQSPATLARHLEELHGMMRFKCAQCDALFWTNQKRSALNCSHPEKDLNNPRKEPLPIIRPEKKKRRRRVIEEDEEDEDDNDDNERYAP